MRDTTKPRDQFALFVDVIEVEVTRDHINDAGTFIRPPPGARMARKQR